MTDARRRAALAGLVTLHAALGLWALAAWIGGPFLGAGILDGTEVLELARTGSAGPFETKSPLYPALLGAVLRATGGGPWTVGLLGLSLSCGVLLATHALARTVMPERPLAALAAAALYALSGSALAFAVQPLPVIAATLALALGALASERAHAPPADPMGARHSARSRHLASAAAGALLAAAAFTRAPLAVPGFALLAWSAVRGRRLALAPLLPVLSSAGAALAVALLCFAAFGARAWPAGSAFNLRQGNGAARSGISDLRPGPEYDRARTGETFAPLPPTGRPLDSETFQRRRLVEELGADPLGAALTLARKAYLFWFRTESPTSADFHHGLRGCPPAPLLFASMGLIAPLALLGLAQLLRARKANAVVLLLAVAGVYLVNVIWLTSARYRFPALPFLCLAAGAFATSRPRPRAWFAALVLAVPLNVNLSGRALLVPGDGYAQEGHLRLARGELAAARVALEHAVSIGRDPRARYDLALTFEREASAAPSAAARAAALARAGELYRAALGLDPLYPQAAENLVRVLVLGGDPVAAEQEARAAFARDPTAGLAALNLAELLRARGADPAQVRELEARGHAAMGLRSLAQGDAAAARRHADEARRRGLSDPRLEARLAPRP